MRKQLIAVAATTLLTSSAMAQSAFEGFYGQVGTGYENNKVSNSTGNITEGGTTYSNLPFNGASASNMPVVVGLGYNYQATKEFLIGLGVDYSVLTTSQFNSSYNATSNSQTGYKVSNRYSIYITPGYVIDKDKLAYLKAGYTNQKLTSYDNYSQSATNGQQTGSGNASGYVVGLGYKQMITSGLYGFGEANYYSYSNPSWSYNTLSNGAKGSNVTGATSNAYQFLVGVGYKF
jgi:outer membrane immunogenic protein